jgi:heptosyltransferase-2
VLAPAWSQGILARMPEVRSAIPAPFPHGFLGIGERRELGQYLEREGYHQAIVLPNSWKSALVPWFAHIPCRTGYVGEFRHILLNDKRRLDAQATPLLVQRFAALAYPPGEAPPRPAPPKLQIFPDVQASTLRRLGLNRAQPILILCPGAEYGSAKRWPEAHYAVVASAKLHQGWQVWLMGSKNDKEVTDKINRLVGNECKNLAGMTSLEDTVDLLACASAVVSNDSGLMHIAAAVDVPVVAVYGSTDPGYTPPYSEKTTILRLGLECSPCFERECPKKHLDCLNKLEPERVLEVLPK